MSLAIEDLSVSTALDQTALSAVRGGDNIMPILTFPTGPLNGDGHCFWFPLPFFGCHDPRLPPDRVYPQ